MEEKESIKVLHECIELQTQKARDYQNPHSSIQQADYYPNGVLTILDIIWAKMLRMRSVIEAMENDPSYKPNFESLEDSFKDTINYCSFGVEYCRGKMQGQEADRNFLNKAITDQESRVVFTRPISDIADSCIADLKALRCGDSVCDMAEVFPIGSGRASGAMCKICQKQIVY